MSRRKNILCIPSRFGSGFLNSNAAHLVMCEEMLTLLCVRSCSPCYVWGAAHLVMCEELLTLLCVRSCSHCHVWGLIFYLHVENTCMTVSFHKRGASAHKTGLTLPRFIEVTLPSQESKRSSICVFGSSICVFGSSICVFGVLILFTVSTIYRLECETVLTMWYFFIFHFILQIT